MSRTIERTHTAGGKRQIIIADDEMINREMLSLILQDEYKIHFAENGKEVIEKLQLYRDSISLVLLDILMPVMSGLDVLKELSKDPELSKIPVIVTTAERDTEVESLRLGASDFISKPYPASDVILARVHKTIELNEDRITISQTERDELTGLYTKEYFYRYVEQYDHLNKDGQMDAIIVDINHFHMLNERYGRSYGNEVLIRLADQVNKVTEVRGGFGCRSEADTFLIYCPHTEDHKELIDKAVSALSDDGSTENRVRLRMGVYPDVDKHIEPERRFDRAKMAADTVRGNLNKNVGYYDDSMHQKELYAEQLIEEFPAAIAEGQFHVYYQPKFDIRPDTPVLASAEALVRWIHPELGMINPGVFIPLFEENGLIQQLDKYVWEEAARQIRDWKERLNYTIPVSVNMSRIDIHNPALSDTLLKIINDNGLSAKNLMLEVTESAYTKDSDQIIAAVENLRKMGFQIEMDDFGTGYSSLNMISSLPIDALKLDMHFLHDAFKEGGNTHMIEVIIGISEYLSVPVIAEGVETEDQLHVLKALGCDIVQGYFFSKPVPSSEFEPFILQKKEADISKDIAGTGSDFLNEAEDEAELKARKARLNVLRRHTDEYLSADSTEKVNTEDISGAEQHEEHHTAFQLRTASIFFIVIAFLAAAALMIADLSVTGGYMRMETASDRYIAAQLATSNMEAGSDYLTDKVRCFVVTGDIEYLKDFNEEVEHSRRRDLAVEDLEQLLGDSDSIAIKNLNTALELSNELVGIENHAMRLMIETGDYDMSIVSDDIKNISLTEDELKMSKEELKEKAQLLVFDNNYMHYKDRIRENVNLCTQALIYSSSQELDQASAQMSLLVNVQTILTVVFFLIVLTIVLVITLTIRKPLTNMVDKMQAEEIIEPTGVEELRFVTRTYNQILIENINAREHLSHEASHDALTGLFNRGAYDLLMESTDREHMALILIDVDEFKKINDTYGHAVGDRILKRVADILRHSFRSVDILCRIGGDEFAVVMTRVTSAMSQLVINKIAQVNDVLQHPKDDLPPVSLSVGVAFSDRKDPQGDIFNDADSALYKVKEAGRKGCAIFE